MAKIETVRDCCDRCGAVNDNEFPNPIPRVKVTIVREDEWHAEAIVWKDLCPPCREEAARLFDEVDANARKARGPQTNPEEGGS